MYCTFPFSDYWRNETLDLPLINNFIFHWVVVKFLVISISIITKAVLIYFQIVGHSLGGGTAALLTYIFREQKEFSSTTCITFAPGMYWLSQMLNYSFFSLCCLVETVNLPQPFSVNMWVIRDLCFGCESNWIFLCIFSFQLIWV